MIAGRQRLQAVDHAATEEKLTRSAFLQEGHGSAGTWKRSSALEKEANERDHAATTGCVPPEGGPPVSRLEKEANERKQRMQKAAANMDKLANKFGKWDGVGTIRQFRDRRTGAKR